MGAAELCCWVGLGEDGAWKHLSDLPVVANWSLTGLSSAAALVPSAPELCSNRSDVQELVNLFGEDDASTNLKPSERRLEHAVRIIVGCRLGVGKSEKLAAGIVAALVSIIDAASFACGKISKTSFNLMLILFLAKQGTTEELAIAEAL